MTLLDIKDRLPEQLFRELLGVSTESEILAILNGKGTHERALRGLEERARELVKRCSPYLNISLRSRIDSPATRGIAAASILAAAWVLGVCAGASLVY